MVAFFPQLFWNCSILIRAKGVGAVDNTTSCSAGIYNPWRQHTSIASQMSPPPSVCKLCIRWPRPRTCLLNQELCCKSFSFHFRSMQSRFLQTRFQDESGSQKAAAGTQFLTEDSGSNARGIFDDLSELHRDEAHLSRLNRPGSKRWAAKDMMATHWSIVGNEFVSYLS